MEENKALKWVLAHGHKVIIWVQFLAALLVWITADPDPSELLKLLESCIAP